jgi:capsular exopolysaccharide synthesis family protein
MAITFAQTGSKTLIIDADMRKPRVHKSFRIQSSPGLSDKLGGFSDIDCLYDTDYENLTVMPAGTIPPNPAELLSSRAMSELLDKLSESFEYIFIDTPPVDVVTDAAALSRFISGVVLIARHGISTKESTKAAVTALEQAGAVILGFMLNDVNIESRYYTRYNYRNYYQLGYGDGDSDLT